MITMIRKNCFMIKCFTQKELKYEEMGQTKQFYSLYMYDQFDKTDSFILCNITSCTLKISLCRKRETINKENNQDNYYIMDYKISVSLITTLMYDHRVKILINTSTYNMSLSNHFIILLMIILCTHLYGTLMIYIIIN